MESPTESQHESQRRHPLLAALFLALLLAACMLLMDGSSSSANRGTPTGASSTLLPQTDHSHKFNSLQRLHHTQPRTKRNDGAETDRIHSNEEPNHRDCSLLPHTRQLMHEWMMYETQASLSLLHSLAASFAALLIADPPSTMRSPSDHVSRCQLAREAHVLPVIGRDGKQQRVEHSGLFFDEQAATYWTWQRPIKGKARRQTDAQPVWLPELMVGDCLVCSDKKKCAGEDESLAEQRKTMRHAPEGWSIIHTHECQQQQADFRPHKEQQWQNECQPVCQLAYDSHGRVRDTKQLYWLSCQLCHRMGAQVDAAADLDVQELSERNISTADGRSSGSGWSATDLATADEIMSKLFYTAQMPELGQEWATSGAMPSLAEDHEPRDSVESVRAFFLNWSGQLSGVSQLVDTALRAPASLRSLFPNTHSPTQPAKPTHGAPSPTIATPVFALALQAPFRRPSRSLERDSQLYAIDVTHVQRTLDGVIGVLSKWQQQRAAVSVGGGGGSGMGLQLACIPVDSTDGIDTTKHAPLLDVGGGGGGGFRSLHMPRRNGDSWFKAGAGGGAGLQSWGVIPASRLNDSADGGITVGGGGGGGLRMRFSHDFDQTMDHHEGRVVSQSHGASPDDTISLPEVDPRSEGGVHSVLHQFSALLAQQMRRCMASSTTSKLVLHSGGGAGGGVKLMVDDAATGQVDDATRHLSSNQSRTVRLQHSVNFKLLYEFSTCGWDRDAFNCAEARAFPDKDARAVAVQRAHVARMHAAAAHELSERESSHRRGNSTHTARASAWSGEMQRRLGACLAASRQLSREYLAEEEEERAAGHRPPSAPGSSVPAPKTVSKKDAYHDLLCTCFHSTFAADPSDPAAASNSASGSAGGGAGSSSSSPLLPSFCKPKPLKSNKKNAIASTDPDKPRAATN